MLNRHLALIAVLILSACQAPAADAPAPPVGAPASAPLTDEERFNFVAGTQTIGASYQFTSQPKLVETAQEIRKMGSNMIKFSMSAKILKENGPADANIHSLAQMAQQDPGTKQVLDMPFAYYFIWCYPLSSGSWFKKFPPEQAAREYTEMYDLTCYLLSTYNGSGKTFYLGHWEGDWMLAGGEGKMDPPPDESIQHMIDWINTRQRAVDDAKRDTPHQNVQVYHYCEVNLVKKAMKGEKRVTTSVLEKTDVDFVSYSSYDNLPTKKSDGDLINALTFIESKLGAKPSIPGKRVFIGEYGFPAKTYTPQETDEKTRLVLHDVLTWGAPFALYWEMFNNEVDATGKQRGFWLIDDKGVKQPVYYMLQHYYADGKAFISDYQKKNGHLPSDQEFRTFGLGWLESNKGKAFTE